jgi:two-component system nitrogen regulation sensor histidine kinase NtrY
MGSERYDIYYGRLPIAPEGGEVLGFLELSLAYVDRVGQPTAPGGGLASVFGETIKSPEFLRFSRDVPDRVDRYRGDLLVASTDPEGGFGKRLPSVVARALATAETTGRWVERRISGKLYDLYCIRERDGERTVGYLTFGLRRGGWLGWGSLLARCVLVTLVLACGLLAFLMLASWLVPESSRRLGVPRLGFRERVIAGFLLVSLVPTVLLGFAGRGLFVREKRQEYRQRLEEDLRVTGELLSRRLSDAARNAAGSAEVRALLARTNRAASLSSPASVDAIAVVSADGNVLGASPGAILDLAAVAADLQIPEISAEFYLRREDALYAGALVPLAEEAGGGDRGAVFAYKRIDRVLAAELERRVGSPISFFANGTLRATSNPELYQSEILSDLVESMAYLKVELEGARRTTLESRVGATSFLTSYAPLIDAAGRPVGIRAAVAPFRGAGLDLDASNVLSRIYFLCLVVLAAACQAAVLLAGRLTRPISDLTAGAERLGAGELGYRIVTQASGEIGGLVRSFNSMSERLATSEARDRERREYIEAIIQHVGSGVVSVDASGTVATVNEAAGRILGVPPAALLGRRLGADADAPAEPAALGGLGAAAATLLAGEEREVVREIEIPPPGEGEPRKLRLVGTPLLGHAGKPQGAVLVFEDLTELIRSEKIKAWAQMARQVAHEIKNPLTPMKLSAQHLRQAWRDKHGKFDRILEESTETIIDRCEALRRIAIEFSDYARMPGRQIRREDLGRLLRDAERLYGESGERGVKLRLDAPEETLWTRVDRDEVMRLFINLIENSVQAMPQGGELSITAWTENGMAHVRIRDTGVGIDSENLGRIFEPSFSTKTGGAGLGLPICKAIVEDYGGSIRIESEKGRGTTVEVTLPAEAAPPAGGAART